MLKAHVQLMKNVSNALISDLESLGKYSHSLSCQAIDEKIDTILIAVHSVCSFSQQPVSLS